MASESGYSNQLKKGIAQFKTIQSLGGGKFGQQVASKALFEKEAAAAIISVTDILDGSGQVEFFSLEITGHNAIKNDVIRIDSGDAQNFEYDVVEVIDANHIKILALVDSSLLVGETASIMGWVTNKANADGSQIITAGPLQFVKDGDTVQVNKDTVDSNNTRGLPVEIVAASGSPINITAGDLNVQLSHTGANPDSTRIGDGTTELGITLTGEAKVYDEQNYNQLESVKFFTQETSDKISTLQTKTNDIYDMLELTNIDVTGLLADANDTIGTDDAVAPVKHVMAGAKIVGYTNMYNEAVTLGAEGDSSSLVQSVNGHLYTLDLYTHDYLQTVSARITTTNTGIGAPADAAAAGDTSSSSMIGLLKRIAQNISSTIAAIGTLASQLPATLGTKLASSSLSVTMASDQPAIPVSTAIAIGSYEEASGIGTGGAFFSPPAGTRKMKIQAPSTNTANMRIKVGSGSPASTTSGMILEPGRSEDFDFGSTVVYYCAESGSQELNIHYGV